MEGKRILICCNRTLVLGGIEKALTTFLKALPLKKNEVWLVLADNKGVLSENIPDEDLKIFYTNSVSGKKILAEDIKKGHFTEVLKGIRNRIKVRTEKNWYARIMYGYRIIEKKLVFPGYFDCAISFSTDYSDLSMILKANTNKRVAFIHGDATANVKAGKLNDPLLRKMDKIYSVSEGAGEQFLKVHPECRGKVDVLHNMIDVQDILEKAELPAPEMEKEEILKLCTVGRVSQEKGQMMIPEITDILQRKGIHLKWYVVGDGGTKKALEEEIQKRNQKDRILLLGARKNPYPYMKNCDIYVQPSFSEAYCTTTIEAKVLNKVCVATNITGMNEQFENGKNGILAEATAESLAKKLEYIILNPEIRMEITEYLKSEKVDYNEDLQKLYDFITDNK